MGKSHRYVFGFDPSLNGFGYAVLEIDDKLNLKGLAEKGVIKGGSNTPSSIKLALIQNKVKELVLKYRPAHHQVFVERGFTKFNTSTQAVYKARGALEAELVGFEIIDIPPTTVKQVITGDGKADKSQVAERVKSIFNGVKFQTSDESDATAVALTGYYKYVKNGGE